MLREHIDDKGKCIPGLWRWSQTSSLAPWMIWAHPEAAVRGSRTRAATSVFPGPHAMENHSQFCLWEGRRCGRWSFWIHIVQNLEWCKIKLLNLYYTSENKQVILKCWFTYSCCGIGTRKKFKLLLYSRGAIHSPISAIQGQCHCVQLSY